MKKILTICFMIASVAFLGCESEDKIAAQPFVVAFENQSHDYSKIVSEQVIGLKFSETAQADGFVTIRITPENAVYGVDFATNPAPVNNEIIVPINAGLGNSSFTFSNLIYPFDSDDKSVKFDIVSIDYPNYTNVQGYTSTVISFERSLGATTEPALGGPNQGNQVYIDLSTETSTEVWRDSWDLGFYSGDAFRVAINGSIYMAARELDGTDIDAVTQASVAAFQSQVTIGTFDPANAVYIDSPNGAITGTAFQEVSSIEANNKVYLVNLGYTVGTSTPPAGSVAVAGNARGWRKVRVVRDGENYKLQYAELNATTHQEVTIAKNPDYNFTFFSFNSNAVVNVEPQKAKWDLCFSVFTNVIDGAGSYGYSDFVLNNAKAGIYVYRVNVSAAVTYENFGLSAIDDNNFTTDQRIIGADWRDVFTGSAYANRFYVLKDLDGNYYKIRMLAFLNESGVRGYPKFEYRLVQ